MKALIILLLIIGLTSCDSSSPVSVIENPSDEDLKSLLISSTYKSELLETKYFSDNTFIEKYYIRNNDDTKVLWYTRTGTYEVKESILYKQDCFIEYNDLAKTIVGGITIIFFDAELTVVDSKLHFNRISVLKSVDNNFENLWGKWETIRWAYHYSDELNSEYQGRQKYFYSFQKDSSKVHYGWEYLYDFPDEFVEFHSEFVYEYPHLELYGPAEYDISVSFKDNKMYWRYGDYNVLNKEFLN